MSKQLAISSAFAVFAMAAMTLSMSAEYGVRASGDAFAAPMAEMPDFDWPSLPLLPNG